MNTLFIDICVGFVQQDFVRGDYKDGFCETLLEASPRSDRDNASQLQNEPGFGQSQAHEIWWYHLCDNMFEKRRKKNYATPESKRPVRETTLQTQ